MFSESIDSQAISGFEIIIFTLKSKKLITIKIIILMPGKINEIYGILLLR